MSYGFTNVGMPIRKFVIIVLVTMKLMKRAWNNVPADTTKDCFQKSGLIKPVELDALIDSEQMRHYTR